MGNRAPAPYDEVKQVPLNTQFTSTSSNSNNNSNNNSNTLIPVNDFTVSSSDGRQWETVQQILAKTRKYDANLRLQVTCAQAENNTSDMLLQRLYKQHLYPPDVEVQLHLQQQQQQQLLDDDACPLFMVHKSILAARSFLMLDILSRQRDSQFLVRLTVPAMIQKNPLFKQCASQLQIAELFRILLEAMYHANVTEFLMTHAALLSDNLHSMQQTVLKLLLLAQWTQFEELVHVCCTLLEFTEKSGIEEFIPSVSDDYMLQQRLKILVERMSSSGNSNHSNHSIHGGRSSSVAQLSISTAMNTDGELQLFVESDMEDHSLSSDLGVLQTSAYFSDVSISVKTSDKEDAPIVGSILGHKAILCAKSEYFSSITNPNEFSITLVETCSIEAIRAFIYFVYTSKLLVEHKVHVIELLYLSRKYKEKLLEDMCLYQISTSERGQSASFRMYMEALKYGLHDVLVMCYQDVALDLLHDRQVQQPATVVGSGMSSETIGQLLRARGEQIPDLKELVPHITQAVVERVTNFDQLITYPPLTMRRNRTQTKLLPANVSYQVALVGSEGSGRSNFLYRLADQLFSDRPSLSLLERKLYFARDNHYVQLLLSEMPSTPQQHHQLEEQTEVHGYIFFFRLDDTKSFEQVTRVLYDKTMNSRGALVPSVLVGTRWDCFEQRTVRPKDACDAAKKLNIPYFEVSSKLDLNLHEVLQEMLFELEIFY